MRGCGADGKIDNSRYSAPVPWIGAYIVAGSLFCAGAMALDAYSGFRRRRCNKVWFHNRFFSLNSTTFTMLAIATKIPVDLNTSMPRAVDQLTKLSGTVLLCTAMANSMPSLADIDSLLSNVVAMGILVVTVAVNIGIQMGTGVIFSFLPEHAVVMVLMLVLLVLTVSSALYNVTTKLEKQYREKLGELESAASDGGAGAGEEEYSSEQKPIIPLDKLKVHLKGCWLMARTSNPQYVLGRSATCTASGAFCLVGAVVLLQALLRALVLRGSATRFCSGDSDYGWSTPLVLATQVAAVVVGTVAPVYRWFYAVNVRSIDREDWTCAGEYFTVEYYWTDRLLDLVPWVKIDSMKFVARFFLVFLILLLVKLQEGVVRASKFVRLLSVVSVYWLREGGRILLRRTESSLSPRRPPAPDDNDLKRFMLHQEGEHDLVRLITRSERRETDMWIQKGRDSQPEALLQLIRDHSTFSEGFRHAGDFDGSGAPPLHPNVPPNWWSLPLVTLAAVAAALPGVEQREVDSLLRGVKEGLRFVMLVEEKNLDAMGLVNNEMKADGRRAAECFWRGLELDRKWLDHDLRSLAGSGKGIAEKLLDITKQEVTEHVDEFGVDEHYLSLVNCMYRVCATVVQCQHPTDAHLFAWLRTAIADVLGACLTNLPRALYLESFSRKVEERERGVRKAALALGEAEAILQLILEQPAEVVSRFPRKTQHLDDWKNRSEAEMHA